MGGERFWLKLKFRKRRNTGCISSFLNCKVGAKDPPTADADLISGYWRKRWHGEAVTDEVLPQYGFA